MSKYQFYGFFIFFSFTSCKRFKQDNIVATYSNERKLEPKIDNPVIANINSDSQLIKDVDGNNYKIVKIGTQIWMAENLRTSHYNDGTLVPIAYDGGGVGDDDSGAYCYASQYQGNNIIYGKLYNWYAVNTGKLAPKGWHIPTKREWRTLINYLGGEEIAGNKMKSSNLWSKSKYIVNTNSSNFTALPGGYKTWSGEYLPTGYVGYFWTSTSCNNQQSWYCKLDFKNSNVLLDYDYTLSSGFSVRCVKN